MSIKHRNCTKYLIDVYAFLLFKNYFHYIDIILIHFILFSFLLSKLLLGLRAIILRSKNKKYIILY